MPSKNEEVLCTYHYDPLDSLIGLNSAKPDALQRFYCKSRLATEIQGLARCSIVQQADLLLAQQKRLGDTLATALLSIDQQRSVMDTVGGNSLPIAYSPYGNRRPESGLTSLLGFNGERLDTITGRYLLGNGYRAFNPVLMRFNSHDSLSPFGKGGLNSYAYCLGDPINRSDKTGEASFLWMTTVKKGFLTRRIKDIKAKPWFEWTSMDIDIVKYNKETKIPFAKSDLQSRDLFHPDASAEIYSPRRLFHLHTSLNLQELSANAVPRKIFLEQPSAVRAVVADVYTRNDVVVDFSRRRLEYAIGFGDVSDIGSKRGATTFRNHFNKLWAVNYELRMAVEKLRGIEHSLTPLGARIMGRI